MKYYQRWWLLVATLLFSSASFAADNNIIVRYRHTNDVHLQAIAKKLQSDSRVQDAINLMKELFILPQPLTIVFGAGGDEGPFYAPESNEIFFPYTFLEKAEKRFKSVNDANIDDSKNSVEKVNYAVMDVTIDALFHEFAHALIDIHKLPVVGKEEDAADSLAMVLSIGYLDDGAEIEMSVGELFGIEGDEITEFDDIDFWDEHSLDLQRYYTTLCHVYGSDHITYAYLLADLGFSDERGDLCIDEYALMEKSWLTLLAPYMRPEIDSNDAVDPN